MTMRFKNLYTYIYLNLLERVVLIYFNEYVQLTL